MVLVTDAIRKDIASQPEAFGALEAAAGESARLSHARLLDILAWNSKGDAPAEGPDATSFEGEEATGGNPGSATK